MFSMCLFFPQVVINTIHQRGNLTSETVIKSEIYIRLTTSKFLFSNTLTIQTSTFCCCCCCYCCKLELLFLKNAEFNLPIYFLEKSLSFKGPNHGSNSNLLYFRPPIAFFFLSLGRFVPS